MRLTSSCYSKTHQVKHKQVYCDFFVALPVGFPPFPAGEGGEAAAPAAGGGDTASISSAVCCQEAPSVSISSKARRCRSRRQRLRCRAFSVGSAFGVDRLRCRSAFGVDRLLCRSVARHATDLLVVIHQAIAEFCLKSSRGQSVEFSTNHRLVLRCI